VLIGDAPSDIESLVARDNVHWLGFRDHQEIPAFGTGFDVALMPYLTNDWIRHCNPIKLKEYLALGLPVVSSDFPEARRHEPHVRVARDHAEFIEFVRASAARQATDEDRSGRRDAIRQSTWSAKADVLLRLTSGQVSEPEGTPNDLIATGAGQS
jgi:glycosyltransferase involved in cell wall biosynthesis